MASLSCMDCKNPYPAQGLPFVCPACGGIYDFDGPPDFEISKIEKGLPGIWRYRQTFDLFPGAPTVSLGEGNTPLQWVEKDGRQVGLKMESQNPTASYKDRGSAVLLSQLLSRGASSAVEDSSGNAGASFAAYAARAGMHARIFVPESASGPKRTQIENYGAELIRVPGPRSEAARAVLEDARAGAVYASHAYMPFGLSGIATIAYEIWEELGAAPGTLISPVGHGGLLLGIVRGFSALRKANLINHLPYYMGVQSQGCAPVVAAFQDGMSAMNNIIESPTMAEGVRVRQPVRARALLNEILPGSGSFVAVAEQDLIAAYRNLALRGFYVEPTSALVWAALANRKNGLPEPIVLILSGLGLKANFT